ncbi:MAG: bifunctional sugar-1-phosphate nucleotidylyltransferase/acetyltransferase [Thermoplasmata archaeon]
MKAFILAAGEGTRMRPLTANIPKPLLPVAGKPFIVHMIDGLREAGIKEATILIGWRGRRVKEHLKDGKNLGIRIRYEEQEKRLGTAHAIGLAEKHMKQKFLCMNGDIILPPEPLRDFIEFSRGKGNVVGLTRVEDSRSFGVVDLKGDIIQGIEEKPERPKSDLINAGIYVFQREIFEVISKTKKSPRGEYEITDSLKILMKKKKVYGFVVPNDWIDVGRPWDLLSANSILMKSIESKTDGELEKNVIVEGEVRIGKGTRVRSGTMIQGPVVIGEDCSIGPNSVIRGSTYIGNGCKVGAGCEVKNSIIMNDTHIPHHNYVGDSIIAERCNLGSGTKIANLRLDEGNIRVFIKGRKIDTGLRKLGTIMGDDVKTGINASIDAGTIIGEGSFVGPGALVGGFISSNSRIY